MTLPAIGALPGERRGYVDAHGLQIHYREMGQGPAVLLFHQEPWASVQYGRILPLAAGAGWRTIALDLPGHGMSDPLADPSVEGFAATVVPLLDHLDIAQVALVGQHGGALVAARAAADIGHRALALVMGNAPLHSAERRAARHRAIDESHVVEPDGSHLTDRWALVRRVGDSEWSDETVHVSVVTYFANGPFREHAHRAAADYDLAADVPRIDCPTLVLAGQKDTLFVSGRALAALRPEWDYQEYSGGSAELFDRPNDWTRRVLEFVGRHASTC